MNEENKYSKRNRNVIVPPKEDAKYWVKDPETGTKRLETRRRRGYKYNRDYKVLSPEELAAQERELKRANAVTPSAAKNSRTQVSQGFFAERKNKASTQGNWFDMSYQQRLEAGTTRHNDRFWTDATDEWDIQFDLLEEYIYKAIMEVEPNRNLDDFSRIMGRDIHIIDVGDKPTITVYDDTALTPQEITKLRNAGIIVVDLARRNETGFPEVVKDFDLEDIKSLKPLILDEVQSWYEGLTGSNDGVPEDITDTIIDIVKNTKHDPEDVTNGVYDYIRDLYNGWFDPEDESEGIEQACDVVGYVEHAVTMKKLAQISSEWEADFVSGDYEDEYGVGQDIAEYTIAAINQTAFKHRNASEDDKVKMVRDKLLAEHEELWEGWFPDDSEETRKQAAMALTTKQMAIITKGMI